MSWVIRVAKPTRIRRGRRGSSHPVEIYQAHLWRHWPLWRKALALALNLPQAAMALTGIKHSRDLGSAWRDLRESLKWNVHTTELQVARQSGVGEASGPLVGNYDKKGINLLLNPRAFPNRENILLDKHRFAQLMRDREGIRTVPTFGKAEVQHALPPWAASSDDLIFKPGFGSRGRGVCRLVRRGAEWFTVREGKEEPIGDLLGWARRWLRDADVVQQRLETHPELAPLSPGALPTLRLVTCINETGEIEVVDATLKLGRGDMIVDNFSTGGLAAPVDLATGRAGAARARSRDWKIARFERHPATEAQIAGFAVPDWEECKRQAILAHEVIRDQDYVLIGWDVGLAATGPVIIEGNWNPGGNLLQTVPGRGLADTRLGELYRYHLPRIPAKRWRKARVITYSSSERRSDT